MKLIDVLESLVVILCIVAVVCFPKDAGGLMLPIVLHVGLRIAHAIRGIRPSVTKIERCHITTTPGSPVVSVSQEEAQ